MGARQVGQIPGKSIVMIMIIIIISVVGVIIMFTSSKLTIVFLRFFRLDVLEVLCASTR